MNKVETAQTKAMNIINSMCEKDKFESSILKQYRPKTKIDVWNFLTNSSVSGRIELLNTVLAKELIPEQLRNIFRAIVTYMPRRKCLPIIICQLIDWLKDANIF